MSKLLHGKVKCDGQGGACQATANSSIEAGKLDWDWFTGYLEDTYHHCAACLKYNRANFKEKQISATSVKPQNSSNNPLQ